MGADASPAKLDAERLGALQCAKLGALVRQHFGPGDREIIQVGDLAAAIGGSNVWVLIPGDATRRLGAVLLWASKFGDRTLHILAEDGADVVARRATSIEPAPRVWTIRGTNLVATDPAPWFEGDTYASESPFAAVLAEHGIDFEVEHGVGVGRFRGLEVARVVAEPEPHLQVGIGRFDREAGVMLRGETSDADALANAADEVRPHRQRGAEPHPIGRLARERWLRWQLLDDPSLVQCNELWPVQPPLPELNLLDAEPSSAIGRASDGVDVLVIAAVGVNPEIVAVAADLAVFHRPARILFAMPERDIVEPLRRSAAMLATPSAFVPVTPEWDQ